MSSKPVISVKKLCKEIDLNGNKLMILNDVSFDIYPGEYVILFGASGSGKSTILNTLSGLEPPTSGQVTIRGENIAKFNDQQLAHFRATKIGIVFQSFNLIKSLRVWENVAFPLMAANEPKAQRRERALGLLKMLGLAKHAFRIPTELSGGQQQRVALARALSSNPWIIIADEPTGNLDSKSADDTMSIFRVLNQKSKRTIIMVTHNPDYLKEANRVLYLRDGKIWKETKRSYSTNIKDVGSLDDLRKMVFHDEQAKDKKDKKDKK